MVGNPPFIGAGACAGPWVTAMSRPCAAPGRRCPESADYVMYWWQQRRRTDPHRASSGASASSPPTACARPSIAGCSERHLSAAQPLVACVFAMPDHPWVDTADGAAVRIAMTVGAGRASGPATARPGRRPSTPDRARGMDVELERTAGAHPCRPAHRGGCRPRPCRCGPIMDLQLTGMSRCSAQGFIVTPEEAAALGLGTRAAAWSGTSSAYRNGRDLTQIAARGHGHRPVRPHRRGGHARVSGGLSVGLGAGEAGAGPEQPRRAERDATGGSSREPTPRLAPALPGCRATSPPSRPPSTAPSCSWTRRILPGQQADRHRLWTTPCDSGRPVQSRPCRPGHWRPAAAWASATTRATTRPAASKPFLFPAPGEPRKANASANWPRPWTPTARPARRCTRA